MDIYDKVEYLLKNKGINRKEMCNQAGINYNTFNGMANRKSKSISTSIIRDIADYFDVPTDYLLSKGIFENWNQILEHWRDIAEYLFNISNGLPKPNYFDDYDHLMLLSLTEKIRLINYFFERIEIDSIKKEIKCYFIEHGISNNNLTLSEQNHIQKYRILDPHGKKIIDLILNEEYDRIIALDQSQMKTEDKKE